MTRRPTSLSFDRWPCTDRALWEKACQTNAFLEPDGPAAHWAEATRKQVANLHEALNAPDSRTEAAEILRGIIERINVTPLGQGSFEIDLTGDIVNMIEFAESGPQTKKAASSEAAVPDAYRSSVKVVAGARCHLYRTWAKR